MASRKTNEQIRTWLKSIAADKDSLDGINAELCLSVIEEQKQKLEKLGIQFNQVLREKNRMREKLDEYIQTDGYNADYYYMDEMNEALIFPDEE